MRSGSVQQMNEALEAQQWRFIRAGTYLVLEKLKQAVLRRLLKKVVLISAEKGNQLALGRSNKTSKSKCEALARYACIAQQCRSLSSIGLWRQHWIRPKLYLSMSWNYAYLLLISDSAMHALQLLEVLCSASARGFAMAAADTQHGGSRMPGGESYI